MKTRLVFIALLIGSLYFGVSYFLDFVSQAQLQIDFGLGFFMLIVASIGLQLAGHVLRASKSRLLLNAVRQSDSTTLFKGLAVGSLFNSLLPLRLGEFIRAFYVGDALAISKTTVFMSIVIERIIDGFVLSFCFVSAGWLVRNNRPDIFEQLAKLGGGLLILSGILVVFLLLVRAENKLVLRMIHRASGLFNVHISNRLRLTAWSAIYGTRLMLNDRRALGRYCGLSLMMWGVYFSSTALAAMAFFNLSLGRLWYVIQSTLIGVSSPAGPGYIGTFDRIVSQLLRAINLPTSNGFPILMWIIIVTPISLVGLFVLVKQRLGVRQSTPPRHALINKLHRDKDISAEFGHFLDAYFQGERINHLLTQAELNDHFKLIKSFKGGSNAHTVLAWQKGAIVVKKITLPQYADKLADQAKWLLERQTLPNLPRVVGQERNDQYYSFDLAYEESFVPYFDYIHHHSHSENVAVLNKVLSFMNDDVYKPGVKQLHTETVSNYITNKVIGKVRDTANRSAVIDQLVTHKKITVNGIKYNNLLVAVDNIQKHQSAMHDLANYAESAIHGDLTIDNLIVSAEGEFMVIDPNNENQISTAVVDYGKMFQSLHSGYEFLIQLETCQVKQNSINFEDTKSQRYEAIYKQLQRRLQKILSPGEYKTILFHEAVHYCRMLTYKAEINPQTVAVFYATATKLFNEFLEQYD